MTLEQTRQLRDTATAAKAAAEDAKEIRRHMERLLHQAQLLAAK